VTIEIRTTPGFLVVQRSDIGEGWWPTVEKALRCMEAVDPGFTVSQVKEKFGGLRLYVAGSEDSTEEQRWTLRALASLAEQEAGNRCEECGAFPARNEPVYKWFRTLCPDHRAEAWIRAHERMNSPASEFPVSEPHEGEEWDGEFPTYDDVPGEEEHYTGDTPPPVGGD